MTDNVSAMVAKSGLNSMQVRKTRNPVKFSRKQKQFINWQVNERLGRFSRPGKQTLSAIVGNLSIETIKAADSRPLLCFEIDGGETATVFERRENPRNYGFIDMLLELDVGPRTRFLADFQDNIAKDYKPFQELGVPVFSKSRPVTPDSCVILWTHKNYRKAREEGIRDVIEPIEWSKKIPELIWRGTANGSVLLANDSYMAAVRLYRGFQNNGPACDVMQIHKTYGDRSFKDIVNENCYRFRLVHDFADRLNVRLTWDNRPEWKDYQSFLETSGYRFGERIPVQDLVGYRYLLVMGGGDAGSQIHWALSSRSLILMPPIVFYSTTTLGLKAWEHFVPVAGDLSDLEAKLDWCRSNDDDCRRIAENARVYVSQFEPHIEDEINQQVVNFYCYAVEKGILRRSFEALMGKR